jgi:hypothetical protein
VTNESRCELASSKYVFSVRFRKECFGLVWTIEGDRAVLLCGISRWYAPRFGCRPLWSCLKSCLVQCSAYHVLSLHPLHLIATAHGTLRI